MFDRPEIGNSVVLVAIDFGDIDFLESLAELKELARSAGLSVVAEVTGKRDRPDPAYFAGTGKVDEVGYCLKSVDANLVIFNHQLSPAQERNLEKRLECRVIDRTSLILDIFAQRAQSHEGKLQVELAQLEHLMTRLVRGWTHLERQKGGIGLRGPGETQLETDRRLIGKRVKLLKDRLAKAKMQRHVQRGARHKGKVFSVSIVGYTNAGKSTLFNRMTKAQAYAANQLFATLDTTSRKVFLAEGENMVLSDTVGFIRQLPHSLVAAFRATLEETIHADLLLHVVDASHPLRDQHIIEVNKVLKEIEADQIPQVIVWNKIDLKPGLEQGVETDEYGKIHGVRVSSLTGDGFDLLRAILRDQATTGTIVATAKESVGSDWSPLDEQA